jgi:protein SCO1
VFPTPTRLTALLIALFLAPSSAPAHSLESLEQDLQAREKYVQIIDKPAPAFSLTDDRGRTVRFADMRGKVVVLWFAYQRCPDVCPLHSEAIANVQAMVNRTPMRDLVRFVTITTDPENDMPESFAGYGASRGLDPVNWTMLTSGPGKPEATREIARQFGLLFTPKGEDYQMHGVVTHIIDKSGHLRARYHGLKFDPATMLVHIKAFSNDSH